MDPKELQNLNNITWELAFQAFKQNPNEGIYDVYSNKRIRDFAILVNKPNMVTEAKVIVSSYTPPKNEMWRKNPEFEKRILEIMAGKEKNRKWLNNFFRYLMFNISLIKLAINENDVSILETALKLEHVPNEIRTNMEKIGLRRKLDG